MTDIDSVMAKLDSQAKKLDAQAKKLDKIESAIVQMAVQDNEIKNMQNQISALWKKIDTLYEPEGLLNKLLIAQGKIIERQSTCEVHSMSKQVKIIWGTIVTMALGIIAKFMNES